MASKIGPYECPNIPGHISICRKKTFSSQNVWYELFYIGCYRLSAYTFLHRKNQAVSDPETVKATTPRKWCDFQRSRESSSYSCERHVEEEMKTYRREILPYGAPRRFQPHPQYHPSIHTDTTNHTPTCIQERVSDEDSVDWRKDESENQNKHYSSALKLLFIHSHSYHRPLIHRLWVQVSWGVSRSLLY